MTDPKTKKETETKELGRAFTCVAFSPDGKRWSPATSTVRSRSTTSRPTRRFAELKAHEGVWALAFSPDGSKLASGGWDQTIKIWDAARGKDCGDDQGRTWAPSPPWSSRATASRSSPAASTAW